LGVRDVVSELVWQKCALGVTGNACENGTPLELSFTDASTACNAVVDPAGLWRVPTHKELQSIVDRRAPNAPFPDAYFPNTPMLLPYWTSTLTPAAGGTGALTVAAGGGTGWAPDLSVGMYVRCVR
jgi:hypothetical protein